MTIAYACGSQMIWTGFKRRCLMVGFRVEGLVGFGVEGMVGFRVEGLVTKDR
jgi:hypothetical protein